MPLTPVPAAFTSVTYTRPASRSPVWTLVSRARTSGSLVSGLGVTPAFCRAWRPNWPHGTSSAHSPIFRFSMPKASSPVTLPGLEGGTAISSLLVANVWGLLALLALTIWSMFEVLADANTSAGAPLRICSRRACEPAKLNFTVVPGYAFSKAAFMSPKASVSEAAANTVMSPLTLLVVDVVPPAELLLSLLPPQAPRTRTPASIASNHRTRVVRMFPPAELVAVTLVVGGGKIRRDGAPRVRVPERVGRAGLPGRAAPPR